MYNSPRASESVKSSSFEDFDRTGMIGNEKSFSTARNKDLVIEESPQKSTKKRSDSQQIIKTPKETLVNMFAGFGLDEESEPVRLFTRKNQLDEKI